jgi:hypothetical protein
VSDTSALFLVEIAPYDPSAGDTTTLRYASGLGHVTGPAETPPNKVYDARVAQPAVMKRTLFGEGTTRGRATVNYGDLELLNEDAGLDELVNLNFDGRAITIRRGPVGGAYPGDFTTDLVGTMQGIEIGMRRVVVKLRDRQAEMETPLQTTKFAGSGLGTLEGVAGDLKGKPKPVCYGKVFNISPPCVETAKLIYQVHDAAVASFDAVRDRGVALASGGTYASTTQLLDNALAPSAGQYKTYSGSEGSFIRLGGTPDGQVTCDVTEGASASDRTAAQVYKRLLTRAGKSSSDWSASDLTTLDTAANYVIGFWTDQETSYARVFDQVAGSVGAAWFVDRTNVFRIQQLLEATGTPVMVFTDNDLVKPFQRVRINDAGGGIPAYQTIVRYRRNYTIQPTDLAAAVTMANRALYEQEWREAKETDTSIQTLHLLAQQVVEDSLLTVEADAQAEATRRQELNGTKHEMLEFTVQLDDDTAAVDLNDVVGLQHPRYNMSVVGDAEEAALFRVLGIAPNAAKHELTLTVWGKPLALVNWVDDDGAFVIDETDDAYVVADI